MELYEHIKMPSSLPPPTLTQSIPTQNNVPQMFSEQSELQTNLFSGIGQTYSDLYVFSPQDSHLWIELFIIASSTSHDLALRFEYVRAVGAWLILDAIWGFRIQPIIDPLGEKGWRPGRYEAESKEWLSPYSQYIIEALKELRRRFDSKQIL